MKVEDLLKELRENSEYQKFKIQNPDTYFFAAFLILNLEEETEEIQLDFYLKKNNKIAAFSYPFSKPKIYEDMISVEKSGATTSSKIKVMKKQTTRIKIDIDDLKTKGNLIIKENKSHIKPTKIIAILKEDIWNLTYMDNMLGIIRIKINAITGKLIDFNKGSLMDFMGIKKK